MESPANHLAGATPFAQMNKLQKLAALLVLLGPETAGQLLKGLEQVEMEAIVGEMAKIGMLSQETQRAILQEFSQVVLEASTSVAGGIDLTHTTLERAIGAGKASHLISRLAPERTASPALRKITQLEPGELFNLIRQEQPQMIALILSLLPPEKASAVLALCGSKLSEEVLERLATLGPAPADVVEKLVQLLTAKLSERNVRAPRQSGGVKTAADLLNALDKNMSKVLLMSLEERNPDLGQAIREKMFTFEDIGALDLSALQKILREVDTRDLAAALKNASERLKTAFLAAISKRAAETVREEINLMGSLKLRDIEAAQRRIIDVVRRLESEGEIELGQAQTARDEAHA